MKKFALAVVSFLAVACIAQYLIVSAAGPAPTALGGTGTSQLPQPGQTLIGNASNTYTPANILCTGNCSVATSSGGITVNVPTQSFPATSSINGTQGNAFTFSASSTGSALSITTSSNGLVTFLLQLSQFLKTALQSLNGATSSQQTVVGGNGVSVSTAAGSTNSTTTVSLTSTINASSVQASVLDNGGAVFNVRAFGAACDDTTDDTNAVNNAIAAAMAGNGTTTNTVYIPGMCLMKGAMIIPYQSASHLPYQNPLRITGGAESWNGYWNGTGLSNYQGDGLDMWFNATTSIVTSSPVAKIDTRGAGLLEIDHLTLKDSSSDNALFFQTTNTTVFLHDDVFSGNASCDKMSCVQPAIALGGFNSTSSELQTATSSDGFQGYGSEIYNDFFEHVDRVITSGQQVNGIMIRNLTVSKTSGGAESSSAPLYFNGPASGNIIEGGTYEVTGYHYMAFLNPSGSGQGNIFDGPGMYDNTASTTGYIYFGTNWDYNTVNVGFLDPALQTGSTTVFGPDLGNQTILSGSRFLPTTVGPAGIKGNLITTSITSVSTGLPNGTNMTIDTGAGGSFLNTKAFSNRFQDQSGNTKDEIQAGTNGNAYFLGKVAAGVTVASTSLQVVDPTNNSSTFLIGASSTKTGCFEIVAASGTTKIIYNYFDSNAILYSTTTKPAFCQ